MTRFSHYLQEIDRINEMATVVCSDWQDWNTGYRMAFAGELAKHDPAVRRKFWIAITQTRGNRFKNEVHQFVQMCWESAGIADNQRV